MSVLLNIKLLLCICLAIKQADCVRNSDYGILPIIPSSSHSYKRVSSYGDSQYGNNNQIKTSLVPLKQVAVVGVILGVGYQILQQFGFLTFERPENINESKHGALDTSEVEALVELKKDQEELWNALLKIHNEQAQLKSLIESSRTGDSFKSELATVVQRLEETIEDRFFKLAKQLEVTNAQMDETESINKEKLKAFNHTFSTEMKEIQSTISDIKSDIPRILQQHDDVITDKLKKFKEDLKAIVSSRRKNAPTTSSAGGKKK